MKLRDLFEGGGFRKVATKTAMLGGEKVTFVLTVGYHDDGGDVDMMQVVIKSPKNTNAPDYNMYATVDSIYLAKEYYQKAIAKIATLSKDLKGSDVFADSSPDNQEKFDKIVAGVLKGYSILSQYNSLEHGWKIKAQRELIDKDLEDYVDL